MIRRNGINRGRMQQVAATLGVVALATAGLQMAASRPPQVEANLAVAATGADLLDSSGFVLPGRAPAAAPVAAAPAPAPAALAPPRPRPSVAQERVIAPPPAVFTGKAAAPAPPPSQLTKAAPAAPTKGTWAVIIGINDYPGAGSDLLSAVNDANDVNEALWRYGVPSENRLVMRNGQATANNVRASIDWLTRNAGPESVAVFFFAGHARKSGSTQSLVLADGKTISDVELAGRMRNLRAARTWIGIAACFGGGFTEVLAPGRILSAAAGPNDLAYENSGFGRSYMVQYMIREAMIEGRAGGTSVEAAFGYAHAAISRDYPNRKPVQYDQAQGLLDLRPAGSPPPNHAGAPAPGTGGGGGQAPPPKDPGSAPPPKDEPPKQQDGCTTLSMGVVKCGEQ